MRQSGLPTGVIPPKQPLPPKAENTMRIQPSAPMTIKRGARWILNHKSSQKVTHGIGVKTMWPLPSRLKPSPGKPKVRHVQLDFRRDHSRVVERLEALGSQIGSVHSILHTAAVVALAAAASDSLFDTFSTETPVSLRSEKRTSENRRQLYGSDREIHPSVQPELTHRGQLYQEIQRLHPFFIGGEQRQEQRRRDSTAS